MWIHMVIYMLLDFRFGGETPPAIRHRATEGPVSLMGSRVLIQNGLLSEIFPALPALVGLLARVYPQMLVQNRPLSEIPPAVDTAIRFFVCMNSQVLG